MANLWSANHPRNFWQCQPNPSDEVWQETIARLLPSLGLPIAQPDIDTILALTLERAGSARTIGSSGGLKKPITKSNLSYRDRSPANCAGFTSAVLRYRGDLAYRAPLRLFPLGGFTTNIITKWQQGNNDPIFLARTQPLCFGAYA